MELEQLEHSDIKSGLGTGFGIGVGLAVAAVVIGLVLAKAAPVPQGTTQWHKRYQR